MAGFGDISEFYISTSDNTIVPAWKSVPVNSGKLTWSASFVMKTLPVSVTRVVINTNDHSTTVYFANGDKSTVVCGQNDEFDIEKGVAIAISKYVMGGSGKFLSACKDAEIYPQEAFRAKVKSDFYLEVSDMLEYLPEILELMGRKIKVVETKTPGIYRYRDILIPESCLEFDDE